MNRNKLSICIACHNQAHLISEAIVSCLKQDYENLEIIVLDDASTDNLRELWAFSFPNVKYFRSDTPSGTGGAFNKAIKYATGDYLLLLCADDVLTDIRVVSDIVNMFEFEPRLGHISRYYHQFIDGDRRPVRAWRCDDVMELANNPSGLAFRVSAIGNCQLSNKMFVEASTLVHDVLDNKKWAFAIMEWDTVAVRIHNSISQNKSYYLKMWNSSPVEEWKKVGGNALLRDFTSLIQIKNNFKIRAVVQECWNFIKYRPRNIFLPQFWFFATVSIFTPRAILRKAPQIYRQTIGRWTTREVKRP